MESIAIYGSGGSAREVAWLAEQCRDAGQALHVLGFIDDDERNHGKLVNELPVRSLEQTWAAFPHAKVVAGIGNGRVRQTVLDKAARRGFATHSLVHPNVVRSRWLQLGEGAVVCAQSILSTNVCIGRHVQINFACTVAHDVVLADFVTLAPGVHISGAVHLGMRAYVGTGAVIVNGTPEEPIVIGEDVVIGAGACVTQSIPAGLTVVGVPAKPIQRG